MARVTGLTLRGGVYQLRTTIPTDLRDRFGRSCIRQSLRTSDRQQAELLGSAERTRLLALFNAARKAPTQAIQDLSAHHRVIEGIDFSLGTNQQPLLQTPAKSQQRQAKAPPPRAQHKSLPTLRQLYERWLQIKKRTKGCENSCLVAVQACEQALGPLTVDKFTRAHGDTFRSWLLKQPISSRTARMYLVWIKTLLRYAYRELEIITKQPWEGLEIELEKQQTRRPWKDEELQKLFTQPLFTAYATPVGQKSGSDAAYWIPLIGLYTGARIGELAQLRATDISVEDGVPLLHITDAGEGQCLKSAASKRSIPIHSELIRLGLLDYVKAIQAEGHTRLWPMLKVDAERPGLQISNWFGEYRRSIGLTEKYPDFHCFRHLVRTKMSRAKIPEKVQDSITGHETQGSIGTKIYQSISFEERIEAIESITYPQLNLPRVFTAPKLEKAKRGGWRGAKKAPNISNKNLRG